MADKAKKTVKDLKEGAEKTAATLKKEAVKTAEELKPAVVKAKTEVTKAAKTAKAKAEEAPAKAKAAAKRVATAATAAVYVQFNGGEKSVDELVDAAKADFKASHDRTKINGLKLYVVPETGMAYYVVNDDETLKGEFHY